MTIYFQRGYDQLKVGEFQTSINTVINSNASTVSSSVVNTAFVLKLTSTSNQTVNLPTAVGAEGRMFVFYKTQATGESTIVPFGTETIDGDPNIKLTTLYASITIISDGSNWLII